MAQLSGIFRLGRDAELRHTPNGQTVCNLALAYNCGMKGTDGKRPTQWIDAALWGKLAEALAPYLLKGGQVYACIGDPRIETYEGKSGTGSKLVGRVLEIELAGSRGDGQQAASPPPAPPPAPRPAPQSFDGMDDDIPF